MNDLDEGRSEERRSETHRLALLGLSRFISERARLAGLFALIHDPIDLQFGDVAVLLEKSPGATGRLSQPPTERTCHGSRPRALRWFAYAAEGCLPFRWVARLRRQRVR